MAETKTYTGGCHCGAVRYEVDTDLAQVIECNCSHCAKKGFLLNFVGLDAFRLQAGEDKLTDYSFNTHNIRHRFCQVCGVQSFAEGKTPSGKAMKAINARCLDDVDLAGLNRVQVDGRSF